MTPRTKTPWPLLLGLAGLLLLASPGLAWAGPVGPLFADRLTWDGFVNYWMGYVRGTSQVIQITTLVLIAALFIITRGKWR